jgi:acyl-CoA reductase-like NAD-dependent aldehyde dehydrogenase
VLEWIVALQDRVEAFRTVQVVVGGPETGRRLALQANIDIVLFQGSYETGMRIRQDTLHEPSKELMLFLGARNPVILDRRINRDLETLILKDALLSAGQNCFNASLLLVNEVFFSEARDSLKESMASIATLAGDSEDWVGPLQESARVERYLKFVNLLEREGASLLVHGNRKAGPVPTGFVLPSLAAFEGLSVSDLKKKASIQSETPGPHLTLIPYRDYHDLSEFFSALSYGLICGFHSEGSREPLISAAGKNFGRIMLNRGLLDFSPTESPFPRKKSGNHARLGFEMMNQLAGRQSVK